MTTGQAGIIAELQRTREKLEKLEQLYNMATDGVEIEAIIYEERAEQLRYSALLRRAKSGDEPGKRR